jgi:hypothetical protein
MKINIRLLILFLIPVLNAVSDLFTHFFKSGLHPGIIRGGLFITFIMYAYAYFSKEATRFYIVSFSLLLFGLVLLSSSFSESLDIYIKFAGSINMFLIPMLLLKNKIEFKGAVIAVFISFSMIVIYLILAQFVPGLGVNEYRRTSINLPAMGDGRGQGVYVLNQISYYSILFPFFFFSTEVDFGKVKRYLYFLLTISSFILLFLTFRRAALLVFLAGLGFIVLYNWKFSKFRWIIIVLVVSSVIGLPYLAESLEDRNTDRGGLDELGEESYGRNHDLMLAFDMATSGDPKKLLLGDVGEIFLHKRVGWVIPDRRVHNDFAIVFLGSGLLGFILFVLIHYKIMTYNTILYSRNKYLGSEYRILFSTILALLLATIIQSFANQYWNISSLSTAFFLLGLLTKYNYLVSKQSFTLGHNQRFL